MAVRHLFCNIKVYIRETEFDWCIDIDWYISEIGEVQFTSPAEDGFKRDRNMQRQVLSVLK